MVRGRHKKTVNGQTRGTKITVSRCVVLLLYSEGLRYFGATPDKKHFFGYIAAISFGSPKTILPGYCR